MDFLKKHWATLALIGLVAIYFGVRMASDQCPLCVISESFRSPDKGDDSPAQWSAQSLTGESLSSQQAKGKVTALVYWATWCGPCLQEIPSLIALRNAYPEDTVSIIGINLDEPSKPIEPFVKARGINYTIARNTESLEAAFGPIHFIPTTLILDQEGKIYKRHTGLVSMEKLQSQIQTLLDTQN